MMRHAAENCALREEVRALRALDSVRSVLETKAQSLTALEKTFLHLLEAQGMEDSTGGDDFNCSNSLFVSICKLRKTTIA